MEISTVTQVPAYQPQSAARLALPEDAGRDPQTPIDRTLVRPEQRPDRPAPEEIAKRLRHLAQDTRADSRELREDFGNLQSKAERLRALHQEAVETGSRKLHRLVHRLAAHLEVELQDTRDAAQDVRAQIAITKRLIERFKDFMGGQDDDPSRVGPPVAEPVGSDAAVPAGELLDVSA